MQMWVAKWTFADGQETKWHEIETNNTAVAILIRTFRSHYYHFQDPNNPVEPVNPGAMISENTTWQLWSGNINTKLTFQVREQREQEPGDSTASGLQVKRKLLDGKETPWLPIQTNDARSIKSEMFGAYNSFGFYNCDGSAVEESDQAADKMTWNVHLLGVFTGINCVFRSN
jgi:hypothetical protein